MRGTRGRWLGVLCAGIVLLAGSLPAVSTASTSRFPILYGRSTTLYSTAGRNLSVSQYYHRVFVPLGRTLFVYDYDGNMITRLRFANYVGSTAMPADGRVAYVTADDALLCLDARTGGVRWRKPLPGLARDIALAAGRVWVVVEPPNGFTRLLSVNPNLPTRSWVEVPRWAGGEAKVAVGAGGALRRIAWTTGGANEGSITVAAAHPDGTISGQRTYRSTGSHELEPLAAQFSANGGEVAFLGDSFANPDSSNDPALGLWDLTKPGIVDRTFVTTHGSAGQVALSPSGRHLVGTIRGWLYVWSTSNPSKPVKTVVFSPDVWPTLQGLAVTPDGRYAFCMVNRDGTQSDWQPELLRIGIGVANW